MSGHILLVEDDPALAELICWHFRKEGFVVEHTVDGDEALLLARENAPDLVLLDWMLPKVSGIEVCRRLRGRPETRNLPVIMLTALSASQDKVEGLEAGADDYVVKPVAAMELHARLTAILRGRGWTATSADTLQAGDIVVSPTSFRAWRGGKPIDLAKLELKLLIELVRNADAVLTRAMLIERVWGYDFMPDTNIVDVHIRRLRRKLTEGGGDDPIQTLRGIGYMMRG